MHRSCALEASVECVRGTLSSALRGPSEVRRRSWPVSCQTCRLGWPGRLIGKKIRKADGDFRSSRSETQSCRGRHVDSVFEALNGCAMLKMLGCMARFRLMCLAPVSLAGAVDWTVLPMQEQHQPLRCFSVFMIISLQSFHHLDHDTRTMSTDRQAPHSHRRVRPIWLSCASRHTSVTTGPSRAAFPPKTCRKDIC